MTDYLTATVAPRFYVGAAQQVPVRDGSIMAAIESPPYFGLRWYGDSALEPGRRGLADYIDEMVEHGREVYRILDDRGTWWLNIGDTSANSGGAGGDHARGGGKEAINYYKQGNMGIKGSQWGLVPWRVAMALQADGWILRAHVVWNKLKNKPESLAHVRRPLLTWEPLFMFVKSKNYKFYYEDLIEQGNVWHFQTSRGKAHQAPFPDELPRRCIMISTDPGDRVWDGYSGSGTTARVAVSLGRVGIGGELYPDVAKDADGREVPIITQAPPRRT